MSTVKETTANGGDASAPDLLKVSILHKDSIHAGFHLVPHIVSTVLTELPSSNYVIVTDTTIAGIHLPALQTEFAAQLSAKQADGKASASTRVHTFQIPPGEGAKSRRQKEEVEDFMLSKGCTRDTVVLALGGGVVGDLTGFVAATYMRGIKFVQIPTTLLAMVDSAVGGKTAVDTPHGKNFVGAFWQPSFIFVDLAFLETLPQREFSNGMAEVIKTAAIWKEDDFEILESRAEEISSAIRQPSRDFQGRTRATRSQGQELLLRVVAGSIYVKSHIVTIDERETGLRNLVNFGHTIGHAIEAILTPKALHGECVSIGIIFEAEVARQLGVLSQVAVGRLTRCLGAYKLPTSLHDPRIVALPQSKLLAVDKLMDIMAVDKKNVGSTKKIVLLSRIGKTYEEKASSVKDDVIRRVLCESVVVRRTKPNAEVTMSTPGSKSISNRALVLAALGRGTCRMRNLLHSDDTAVMMAALTELKGAAFSWEDGGDTLVVQGGAGKLDAPSTEKEIYLGNAGTAARFLAAVCTLVQPTAQSKHTTITGNARMKQRPIGPLVDALRENGADIEYRESEGSLPLKVAAGGLRGGRIRLAASVSSQYVSAVLLCAPYATEEITLELTGGQVISQPYIDMTIAMMREFGVDVIREGTADVYRIPRGHYVNPAIYNVESDASSATYPLAIAAITGTTCTIENIGTASLQGDAGFAKNILEPMGCQVTQTANRTTVRGPPIGQLRALGLVDMETMTDAFLTASVLAAVATQPATTPAEGLPANATKIFGIANQRVKECNRIKAMRDQLAKFGVQTDEFDDGIIVLGSDVQSLKAGARIHCYDDHRVAMAFSVLTTVVAETIIDEKRCVEKTWPNWWDDLSRIIGVPVEGIDLHESAESSTSAAAGKVIDTTSSGSTIFLIGMRGAGKTTVGNIASNMLRRPFLDADDFFVEQEGQQIADFVKQNGWAEFRARETEHLRKLIQERGTGHVVSLGGGVVETPDARELLKQYNGPVVHVAREIDEIRKYLGEIGETHATRPIYSESAADVFRRRQPWFIESSNYEFVNYTTGALGDTSSSMREVQRFFSLISGNFRGWPDVSVDHPTRFLSLTFPDVTPLLSVMDTVEVGVDAIELRVDLLSPSGSAPKSPAIPPAAFVGHQLAALRAHTRLPIIFSVRTAGQGGFFPDGQVEAYADLVKTGIRCGCEYIDVEMNLPDETIEDLVANKGFSRIIASWHDWSGTAKWDGEQIQKYYERADNYGDLIKLVGTAKEDYDNTLLFTFVRQARQRSSKPLLAINMGAIGQLTRVLNPILSPVTHPALTKAAAPGQMSVKQIHQTLHLIGKIPAQKYYLFGNPISQSLSPIIHNTGFELLGLPHKYSLHETDEVHSTIPALLDDPAFGGASVTIPHKLNIIPLLNEISPDARVIGAVNTITPKNVKGRRVLFGDNSDWKAIRLTAERALATKPLQESLVALVIGAGGTSRAAIYAAHKLGAKTILLFNRTKENAAKVAESFAEEYNIRCITDLAEAARAQPSVIISTVPGTSCTLKDDQSGIYLTTELLSNPAGGVVIDLAYRPNETALITLAKENRAGNWEQVTGVEILCEQAFVQFEGWTGCRAPSQLVRQAALQKYHQA